MVIEDFGPELIYIKGDNNIVADAMSRLDTEAKELNWFEQGTGNIYDIAQGLATCEKQSIKALNKKATDLYTLAALYGSEELNEEIYPLKFKLIQVEQQKDRKLLELARTSNAHYQVKDFLRDRKKHQLICLNNKIVVPTSLQNRIVQWYHNTLCHPGQNRTETTIRQHFTWKGLRNDVEKVCKKCHA